MKKRVRRAARIVLCRPDKTVLLFRFSYGTGALAGRSYWALPGGGLDGCETPEEGAARELREETGLEGQALGGVRFETEYDMTLMDGEEVLQHDYYFLLPTETMPDLSRDGLTEEELETLVEYRWWTAGEMEASGEEFMPPELADTIRGAGGF